MIRDCVGSGNAVKVTVLHIPPAPHLTSSTTTSTTGSFTLSWTAATGAASYVGWLTRIKRPSHGCA